MFNYSNVEENNMKKSYKIDVDCANCANKMEVAANNTEGVKLLVGVIRQILSYLKR